MMDRFVGICCVAVVVMLLWSGCRSEEVNPTYTIVPDDSATTPIAATTEVPDRIEYGETEQVDRQLSGAPTVMPIAVSTEVPDRMESGETDLQLPGAPSVTPVASSSGFPAAYVSPSIDEQILSSGIIVRSQLDSVQAATETVDSGDGQSTSYRAVHELRFRAIEYLKGSGLGAVTVVVRGSHVFDNSGEALAEAQFRVDTRNTFWDEREAILFLNVSTAEYGSASEWSPVRGALDAEEGDVFAFTHSNPGVQGDWDYTIETLSRAWLPAVEASDGSASTSTADQQQIFVIETGPPAIGVKLEVLVQQIVAWDAAIDAGSGIAGYNECLFYRVLSKRHRRAVPFPLEGIQESVTKESGTSAGDVAWSHEHNYDLPAYDRFWLDGEDERYFSSVRVDDDSEASNGYSQVVSIQRPLAQGTYVVHEYWQPFVAVPCNFYAEDEYVEWTVEVKAPAGTLHEAFFDPVALSGGGVGATWEYGAIEPYEFTVVSDVVRIDGLEWLNGGVLLTLDGYVPLSGYTLDFIELDGSISTSLDFADALVNEAVGTWSWSVDSQPWEDGGLLMVRIRETDAAAG